MHRSLYSICLLILFGILLTTCYTSAASPTLLPSETPLPTFTHTLASTVTQKPTFTTMPTFTSTPTVTRTPTRTFTPTQSLTPSITPTPTFTFPTVTVLMQANCRYGLGTAYLYAWGMYTGDTGTVWGRNGSGTWLWIQPDNIQYQCWIAASVVEIHGDIFTLRVAPVRLPQSTLYGPPQGITQCGMAIR